MSITRIAVNVLICAVVALPARATGMPLQQPQHEHQQPAAKPGEMSMKCQEMMAAHQKMMTEMTAADRRLDELVAKMNSATGPAKVEATAAAVTELVTERKAMHERMMKMHQGTMGHMMEHMQAGKESMAMCPMMKEMGAMKH